MQELSIADLCEEFNVYLMDRFGYKRRPATHNRKTISARLKKFDLYFRFRPSREPWDTDTFVIARIGFQDVRQGHGTDLVKFIISLADKYSIKKIGIEETNENSSLFAQFLGFKEVRRDYWLINISEMKI
jgi:hypothetical protein